MSVCVTRLNDVLSISFQKRYYYRYCESRQQAIAAYAGFEQILVLQNDYELEVSGALSTFVYRTGLLSRRYSYAAAAGLFRSVIYTFEIGAS